MLTKNENDITEQISELVLQIIALHAPDAIGLAPSKYVQFSLLRPPQERVTE